MRLHGLDLNLLLALDALLQTASVTGAAEALHVTQPTMSGSLSRLREHFNDPLLLPAGRGLSRSPLGHLLQTPVRDTLRQIEHTISLRPTFDPAQGRRHFTLCASDMTVLLLGAPLLQHLQRVAPGVTVEWVNAGPQDSGERLRHGEYDLTFVAEPFADPAHPSLLAIEDRFVCIAWRGNRRVGRTLTQQTYLDLGHVGTRYGPHGVPGVEEQAAQALALARRMEVTCTSPALVGAMVVGTTRLATLAARLAQRQARELPLRLLELPCPFPPLRIVMQWNRNREGDGPLDWLRQTVLEIAGTDCLPGRVSAASCGAARRPRPATGSLRYRRTAGPPAP